MWQDQDIIPGRKIKIRNIIFILLGVAVLIFKSNYSGPLSVSVQSYAGNIAVSFAVYFITYFIPFQNKYKRLLTALIALGVVELFEILDGFGLMSNVYDPFDLIANIVGVAVGFSLDSALAYRQKTASDKKTTAG